MSHSPQPVEPPRVANPEAISAVEATSAQSPPRRPLVITHRYSGRALAPASSIRLASSPDLRCPHRVFQPDAIGEVNTPSLLPLPSAVFAPLPGVDISDVNVWRTVKAAARVWSGVSIKSPQRGPMSLRGYLAVMQSDPDPSRASTLRWWNEDCLQRDGLRRRLLLFRHRGGRRVGRFVGKGRR